MKTKLLARFLAMFMLLCMLTTLFAACNKEKDKPEDTTVADNGGNDAEVTTTVEQGLYKPEPHDFGMEEYTVLIESEEQLEFYESADGLEGDAVSSSMFTRDAYIEETYKLAIVYNTQPTGYGRGDYVDQMMSADEDLWDVSYLLAGTCMQLNIHQGHFIDLNEVRELNLDASYWDQQIQNDYSFNGMLFTLEGDYTILDELQSMAVFYNYKLYEDWNYQNEYGSPYELVNSGIWTYDLMLKMLKNTSSFAASGGEGTIDDTWGMLLNMQSAHAFFLGSGLKTMQVVDDETQLLFTDDTQFNNARDIIDKILKTSHEENDEILNSGIKNANDFFGEKTIHTMFTDDQALFIQGTIYDALKYRDMESRFGILPIPKYYDAETQDEYYCWVISYHCPMTIPKTVITRGDIEQTATIAEMIAYYSKYAPNGGLSVYDSFYEKMVYAKLCRDPVNDYKMLEIIYGSKAYDIDSAANISRFMNLSIQIIAEGELKYGPDRKYTMSVSYDKLASCMQALKDAAGTTLDNYLNGIEDKVIEVN